MNEFEVKMVEKWQTDWFRPENELTNLGESLSYLRSSSEAIYFKSCTTNPYSGIMKGLTES